MQSYTLEKEINHGMGFGSTWGESTIFIWAHRMDFMHTLLQWDVQNYLPAWLGTRYHSIHGWVGHPLNDIDDCLLLPYTSYGKRSSLSI